MAGCGPAPKDPNRRARRNKNDQLHIVEYTPATQPQLPDEWEWPAETVNWWQMWAESPLSNEFSLTDWSFLLDTAILHAKLWGDGDTTVLPELRIRVAKFGATPEDRARLRIQFATANETEDRCDRKRQAGSQARSRLQAVKNV